MAMSLWQWMTAMDDGKWRYFSQDSIDDFLFEPVEQPAEQTTE